MCRASAAGDDDFEAGRLGALGEGKQPVRGAMRGDDAFLASHAEGGEGFGGVAHGVPVRLASHDDGDWGGGGHTGNSFWESKKKNPIIGSAPTSPRRGKPSRMSNPSLLKPPHSSL